MWCDPRLAILALERKALDKKKMYFELSLLFALVGAKRKVRFISPFFSNSLS